MAVDNSTLQRLRCLPALDCLQALGAHLKVDRTYVPRSAIATQRIHVSAAGRDWELLVEGEKFYDTRGQVGGGGAIDLVMHLWGLKFKAAVAMRLEAGL